MRGGKNRGRETEKEQSQKKEPEKKKVDKCIASIDIWNCLKAQGSYTGEATEFALNAMIQKIDKQKNKSQSWRWHLPSLADHGLKQFIWAPA